MTALQPAIAYPLDGLGGGQLRVGSQVFGSEKLIKLQDRVIDTPQRKQAGFQSKFSCLIIECRHSMKQISVSPRL